MLANNFIAKPQLGFNFFLEKIKNNQNFSFNCKIIEENEDNNLRMKFMSILMNGQISSKFIRISDGKELKEKEIIFEINDIKMKIFYGTFYFFIEKFKLKENSKLNKFGNYKKESEYLFDSIKIYKTIDKIDKKENHLCSFLFKAYEIIDKNKKFEFRDSKGQLIQIEENIFNFKFENEKIYYFTGFLYDISNYKFKPTIISNIQAHSFNNEKIYNSNEIFESKINSVINFEGRITTFNISKQLIIVKITGNKSLKVNVNYKLLKKISMNNECKFLNFLKIKNDEFNFSDLSDIESKEKTFLKFSFLDFDKNKNKYYNNIKINDKYYPINNENMIIELSYNNELNIFLQEIFYVKLHNEVIKDSFKFCLELNKGKLTQITSLLGKDGYCYQFLIQSLKEEDLPKNIPITVNSNNIIYLENPDKNNNKLKEMFTIVNVPEQNVKNIFGIQNDKTDNKIENIYDWKYMITINNEKKKDFKKFLKAPIPNEKKNLAYQKKFKLQCKE